jgi:hypothetical protein
MTIHILPDGTARHLHSETELATAIDAALAGPRQIQRASEVEFNNATQKWEVRLPNADPTTAPLFTHTSRTACLMWEDQHILHHIHIASPSLT